MDTPSSGIEALDELLDLPHLNVLLCGILAHFGCEIALESRLLYRERGNWASRRRGEREEEEEEIRGGGLVTCRI